MALDQYTPLDVKHATCPIPFGSTTPSAANVTAMIAGVADRTEYALLRGPYVAYSEAGGLATGSGGSVVGPTDSAGNWQDFASGSGITSSVTITGAVGDRIEVFFRGDLASTGVGNVGSFRLAWALSGVTTGLDVTEVVSVWDYATMAFPMPVAVGAVIAVATAGTYTIKMQGKNSDPGQIGVLAQHRCYLRAVRHRPTV